MLWLLTVVTTGALGVIALFVVHISKTPTVARPAALSAKTRPTAGATATGHRITPHKKTTPHKKPAPAVSRPQLTDATSGLSYQRLSSPWRSGCPGTLNTPMFAWTAGENAVAGQVTIGGSTIDWHGLACSGLLQQQFAYAGPADLEPTAMSLADALNPAYYAGVPHQRTVQESSAMQVSGHQAWVVKFEMTYPGDDAAQGVTWSSELGALVVVDRGTGQAPSVFYVSVPGNLGLGTVGLLLGSLRLT